MTNHRGLRMAEAIREVVSESILFSVSDPRVRGVTVLNVEMSNDLHAATILFTVMGSDQEKSQAVRGLTSATGYLQSLVAARLQTRFTPVLRFKRDDGISKSVEMSRLIDETISNDRVEREAEIAAERAHLHSDETQDDGEESHDV
jgi:ribosome-binding factor A